MSTSRLEKFIYAICSMEVSDLPAPLSRIEILWNCLITGETPDFEPQSRNEQYLMAMLGLYELENLPTPMSRGEKLLYKIAMGETDLSDIPAYLSRYEELLGYLAENGGVGDFEYILQTLNQRLSTLYSTKERPIKQAVIKGDTLVNELPRPSLKNTMTNVVSQKLNQGYDNGKTLENLVPSNYKIDWTLESNVWLSTFLYETSATEAYKIKVTKPTKPSTKYLIICNIKENDATGEVLLINTDIACVFTEHHRVPVGAKGIYKCIMTTKDDLTDTGIVIRAQSAGCGGTGNSKFVADSFMLFEYQDGMENWDIPYFEGTKTFSATPNVVDGEFKQAVVKGDTLVNELPRPSLKNTMTNVGSQKLNKGYDAVNAVDGEFKQAVVKGQTLVNLMTSYMDERLVQYENPPASQNVANVSMLKPNTEYTLFYKAKYQEEGNIGSLFIRFIPGGGDDIDVSQNYKFTTQYQQCVCKFTTPSTVNYFVFRTNGHYFHVKEAMLLEGDHTKEVVPCFTGIQSVKLPVLTTTGKNLFDLEQYPFKNNIAYVDGELRNWGDYSGIEKYFPVQPNTSYAFSNSTGKQIAYGLVYYDANYNVLDYYNNGINTFTTPNFCNYIRFSIKSSALPTWVQIEEGSTVTSYEPYKTNILTVNEDITLRGIGNVQDTLDCLTGEVTERIVEFNFNEDFVNKVSAVTELESVYRFNISPIKGLSNNYVTKSVCDKFKIDTQYLGEYEHAYYWNETFYFFIEKSKIDGTIKAFKTYITNNPIKFQTVLPTESIKTVNTTITDQDGVTQTKLHAFNYGHISVSSQGLLPSAVNYEVPTNNSYYLPDMLTLGAQYTSRGSSACNATIDGSVIALNANGTFTTPSRLTNRLMVLDTPVDDLMFIKGDQTTKELDYFEGMQSVQLSEVTTTGKNLWNGEFEKENGYYKQSDGIFISSDNHNSIKINAKQNTEYAFQCDISTTNTASAWSNVSYWDENENYISGESNIKELYTTPSNTKYIRFAMNKNIHDITEWTNAFQIEEGSVATAYEPYQSNTLTLAEPVNLRKVGDVEDEFDALTGQVTERVGEYIITGNEKWETNTENNCQRFSFSSSEILIIWDQNDGNYKDNMMYIKCDKLQGVVWANSWNRVNTITTNARCIYMQLPLGTTMEEVKAMLIGTKIQYALANPTNKTVSPTITDQDGATQTKLHSFNDGHLSVSSQGLFPTVNYEVPTNNSYYLPDMLTLGAQYTSRGSADCHATIDGKLLALGKNRTFTTPSTLTNRLMVLDTPVDDLMFIKGDQTAKDFGYFEGMKSVEVSGIQIEKGSVATPYEPYKSTTLTLNEPVTLRKVGDVQDTFDGLTGEVTERVGEVVLDDSFIYQTSSSANGENTMYFQCDLGARPGSKPISSQFKTVSVNLYVSSNDFEAIRVTGSGYLQIRISKSKLNSLDVNGLNEYLRQNDIDIRYELAEPITKTVDLTTIDQDGQPTKLKTFNDISYVEIDADNLIPSVDVEVATKISETLSTLGLEHHDISETQDQLGQTIDEQTENTDAAMLATTEIYENL